MMDISIEHHDSAVPAFAEAELDRLYGNIYSSLSHFRLHGALEGANTYAACQNGEVIALLLYKVVGERVQVVNEGMILPAEEVERFTASVFERFPSVSVVEFHAVHAEMKNSSRPYQRFYQTEDFILQLPESTDAYLAMLGSATRKNVKKYANRWQRDFPSFEYQVYEKDRIEEPHFREIVAFNHQRMAAKNRVSAIDEAELQSMLQMARECGLLCVARIDGRICAGTLMFQFGDHYVSRVNAHDTEYDDHRLGTLACYWAICESIRRGGTTFHLMWGRYAYKTALGGVLYELDHIAIYRSYWHLLRQARLAALTAYSGYQREAKMWLLEQRNATGTVPRLTNACLHTVRALKRMKPGKVSG